MLRKNFVLFFLFFSPCALVYSVFIDFYESIEQKIVVGTKRIQLEEFPNAFNPSLFKIEEGFLLSFRYCPNRHELPWVSFIGVIILNDSFEPISHPELLNTRFQNSIIPSQSEDARIFSYRGRLFLIYNDNMDTIVSSMAERRHMYMAELHSENGHFSLSRPLKLIYEEKYHTALWQKNWAPFEWNGSLLFTFTVNPHEVIYPNLKSGACYFCYKTPAPLDWNLGPLRGSSPPLLVDGEYLAFFHSGTIVSSLSSWGEEIWHYFMGAYTFSADPPFALTKFTPRPIVGEGFYTQSRHTKRVIFPGGFVVSEPFIYMAYGKDDHEIWIATLDKKVLKNALVPVK